MTGGASDSLMVKGVVGNGPDVVSERFGEEAKHTY